MNEKLAELQDRIDKLTLMRIENPEAFHSSVAEGILLGLLEAQDIFSGDKDD